jgi:hypothetical protein
LNNGLLLWVRAAFKANAAAIQDFEEKIAGLGKRKPKFLQFCIEMFRRALLMNWRNQIVSLF